MKQEKLRFRTGLCWHSGMDLQDWRTLKEICEEEIKDLKKIMENSK
jgi:hypothetical protein